MPGREDRLRSFVHDGSDAVDLSATLPAEASPDSAPPGPTVELGKRLGRYFVIGSLGVGGMGMVVAGYDPDLDRKVAIKVLRREYWNYAGDEARRLLQREAVLMARLSHPNIVTVHDVGTWEDQVFVAMEYVDGVPLGTWCEQQERGWREILDVCVAAGRGLAAAHEAGLVHRDVKPENILIGSDGRVLVADFGLAHLTESPRDGKHLGGTPAYMAPELPRGEPSNPLTDQFAFCVTAYEALYGTRPFSGDSWAELAGEIATGRVAPPAAGIAVPGRVRRALVRGMRPDPDERFPSMDALLDALVAEPPRRGRRFAAVGALAVGAAVAAGLVVTRESPQARQRAAAREQIDAVWGDPDRRMLGDAFLASGNLRADGVFERTARRLDRYAGGWVDARVDAWRAHDRGEQSGTLFDLRVACLERRRAELGALVDVLADAPDADTVDRAVQMAFDLVPVDGCADTEALIGEVKPPERPAVRARVDRLRRDLAEVRALEAAGRYKLALERLEPLVREARDVPYAPVTAEALLLLGSLRNTTEDGAGAEAALREALALAAEAGDDQTVARVWAKLLHAVGVTSHHTDAALGWTLAAETAAARAGDDGARAELLKSIGAVHVEASQFDEAQRRYQEALALTVSAYGERHPKVAVLEFNIGFMHHQRGRYADARAGYARARELWVETLGPDHPDVADAENNLAALAYREGRYGEAAEHFARALEVHEAAFGPEHPRALDTRGNYAAALTEQGDLEAARRQVGKVLALRQKVHGPEHPRVAVSLVHMGSILMAQSRFDEAAEYYERALALREQALGVDALETASALEYLGDVEGRRGRHSESLRCYQRAVDIYGRKLDPKHPDSVTALAGVGEAQLALGKADRALVTLERALAIVDGGETDAGSSGRVRFAAARALWIARPSQRKRAVELASQARADVEADGSDAQREAVTTWLAHHAP